MMDENRLDAMQTVADGLRKDGDTIRAECVEELIAEVRRMWDVIEAVAIAMRIGETRQNDTRPKDLA